MGSKPQVVPAWTTLHWAAWRGDTGTVSSLIQRGTDLQIRDPDGWTALHCAAANDPSGECAKLLLKGGARVDSRSSSGATALHVATGRNNETAMVALLEAGAVNDVVDYHDKTPLNFAVSLLGKDILLGAWEGVNNESNEENSLDGNGPISDVRSPAEDSQQKGVEDQHGAINQQNVSDQNVTNQEVVDVQPDASDQQNVDKPEDVGEKQDVVEGQNDQAQHITKQQNVNSRGNSKTKLAGIPE